jgi:hypothetical protein
MLSSKIIGLLKKINAIKVYLLLVLYNWAALPWLHNRSIEQPNNPKAQY